MRFQYDLYGMGETFELKTLENADYLIPEGVYPLRMTWSPRFKKMMPEICDVPGRSGIRIHLGSKPEHSKGCVLMENIAALNMVKNYIYSVKENTRCREDVQIKVQS